MIIKNNAKAQMINTTVSRMSQAYKQVQTTINTSTNKELLDYIFYLNIMNLDKKGKNNKLLVDVTSALVDLQASSGKGY
jgi:hypothetical protein